MNTLMYLPLTKTAYRSVFISITKFYCSCHTSSRKCHWLPTMVIQSPLMKPLHLLLFCSHITISSAVSSLQITFRFDAVACISPWSVQPCFVLSLLRVVTMRSTYFQDVKPWDSAHCQHSCWLLAWLPIQPRWHWVVHPVYLWIYTRYTFVISCKIMFIHVLLYILHFFHNRAFFPVIFYWNPGQLRTLLQLKLEIKITYCYSLYDCK
jgi:hypothetical protein